MKEIDELYVFKRLYELCKWFLHHTDKFPRSHRFSIAVRIESTLLDIIELIGKAKTRQNKMNLLISADEKLFHLKILNRLSYEMSFINIQSYEYAACEMVEIGRMLGGWMKHIKSSA